jgi:hypothetical protein
MGMTREAEICLVKSAFRVNFLDSYATLTNWISRYINICFDGNKITQINLTFYLTEILAVYTRKNVILSLCASKVSKKPIRPMGKRRWGLCTQKYTWQKQSDFLLLKLVRWSQTHVEHRVIFLKIIRTEFIFKTSTLHKKKQKELARTSITFNESTLCSKLYAYFLCKLRNWRNYFCKSEESRMYLLLHFAAPWVV